MFILFNNISFVILNILSYIDSFFSNQQHWITFFGLIATLVSLYIGFTKIRKRIEEFRKNAVLQISSSLIISTRTIIEDLLSSDYLTNKDLYQRKVMDLNKNIISIRSYVKQNNIILGEDFQSALTKTILFEKQITSNIRTEDNKFDLKRYLGFLSELKSILCTIENKSNLLTKDK